MSRNLVIGDLHFGIKSNNTIWYEYQERFVQNQIIPAIQENDIDNIIFLGDLFDIRYSINQFIGINAKRVITNLIDKFKDKKFIFIAGNHDYYSPNEELQEYNVYDMLFDKDFRKNHTNATFVTKDPLFIDGMLFLPWYYTENPEHFDSLLYNFKFGREVQSIYCHTDLAIWPGPRITALCGCPVYSGHIHNIIIDEENKLYNLGSACSFTFSDVNETKFLYIIEDHKIVDKIANITTPSFKRFYNEEIFTITEHDVKDAYIQLCVSNSNINKASYIEQIKLLKTTYTDSNIRVHPIDDTMSSTTFVAEGFNTNISQFIDENMPEYLTVKYEIIKDKVKDKK